MKAFKPGSASPLLALAAYASALILFLAMRWTLPFTLIGPAAFAWLVLFGLGLARRWQSGLLLLLTLPAGMASAFLVGLAIGWLAGVPPAASS